MMLTSIRLRDFLSFKDTDFLELLPLNVFIGPNGSGKSNLIESIRLLHLLPAGKAVERAIWSGGGTREWVWKGAGGKRDTLSLSALVEGLGAQPPLNYLLSVSAQGQALSLSESIRSLEEQSTMYFDYGEDMRPRLKTRDGYRSIDVANYAYEQSVLAQVSDPTNQYPEISHLARSFASIRIFPPWIPVRDQGPKIPQPADLKNDFLDPDGKNLGLVLNRIRQNSSAKRALLENIQFIYEGVEDIDVSIEGNTVQVFLQERGWTIPSTRLSDGTLRWICLLTILLHPNPPGLICLEEPEIGLHPDLLPRLADLLRDASTRTQLIVTTHSETLIDAFTTTPECVIICEKVEGATEMKRLNREELSGWLEKYSLGKLWSRGDIGGNRW